MKKITLAIAAIGLLTANAASAADLAARPYTKAPPPVVSVYNWTGFYIGVNVGGAWDNTVDEVPSAAFGATAFPASIRRDGFTAGGQIGYNWQATNWVFGLEADFNYVDFRSSSVSIAAPLPTAFGSGAPPNVFTYTAGSQNFFGTVRGRIGYAWNTFMLYATGGLAYGDGITNTVTYTNAGGITYATFAGSSGNRVGWTVGGGGEWAFAGNWSVKAEYLYVDLNSHNRTLVPVNVIGTAVGPGFTFADTGGDRFHVARVGLNYKFGGPVVARY